jgi:putative transposase
VKGQWKYLYRAADRDGNTVDFLLCAWRDKHAAQRYFEQSMIHNGAQQTVAIDKSEANLAALKAINVERKVPIRTRQRTYLNNIVEQDHRVIKRRIRSMLEFKTFSCARILITGIELMHMIYKGQLKHYNFQPLLPSSFTLSLHNPPAHQTTLCSSFPYRDKSLLIP